ncbi:MmcQ/YjbR family DNA-binding protein [Pedococcus aerophilus]|uniref:MmcQ/YjbR family DNA-binding protein n=1 Tax=Pedococcus aerophilus TaxID=436356 RepID=A0ABP6H3J4_9MICO
MTARKAKLADIGDIALGLPEVEEGTSWGRPAYVVRKKSFVHFREPRPDAVDPDTGERMDDVIIVTVADQDDKEALVASDGPWFTTPHFDGYNAVLVRERDLGKLTRRELEEVITDAWAARAPKRLVAKFFDEA